MSDDVPEHVRFLVESREGFRCALCGGRGTDWHHRRRRGVRDEFTHSAANGVLLCRRCHGWIHSNPLAARSAGFIVSAYVTDPSQVPIQMFRRGRVLLSAEGGVQKAPPITEPGGDVIEFRPRV